MLNLKRFFQSSKSRREAFLALLAVLCLGFFAVAVVLLYEQNERRFLRAKSDQIAEGIAHSLESAIRYQTSVLSVTGEALRNGHAPRAEKMAKAILREIPGFYAINQVSPLGVIVKVEPPEKNHAALGQNLLKRPDVRDYLLKAKELSKAQMSHKLMTYQGIPAFTLYVPLFRDGVFSGWLNGVVDFDGWLADFRRARQLTGTRILVSWDHPESAVVDQGPRELETSFASTHEVLNQKMKIQIGFGSDELDHRRSEHLQVILIAGIILLLIAVVLIVWQSLTQIRLRQLNQTMALQNNLLSSVTHDLSTPLTILGMNLEGLFLRDQVPTPEQKQSLKRIMASLGAILESVKTLHAQRLGVLRIETQAVSLQKVVELACEGARPLAAAKKIQFDLTFGPEPLNVLAEESTLIHNVLLNVLGNAIKFSPPGASIRVRSEKSAGEIRLVIENEGEGFTPEQLARIKKLESVGSTPGTSGEKGTGLGLLQIHGFMMGYGGRVEFANCPNGGGGRVILSFRPAES